MRNPVLIGLLIGVLLAVMGRPIPAPLAKAIDMLAGAAGPAALFVIGGSLYGLRPKGMVRDMGQIAIGKLVLHPLAVFGIFLLLPDIDPLLLTGACCSPAPDDQRLSDIRAALRAERYHCRRLMVSTLGSFVTISWCCG